MTRVGIIGPGAIGGTIAAALVGRPDINLHIAARQPFQTLRFTGGPSPVETAVDVHVVPSPTPPMDIVIVATKAHQALGAVPWFNVWSSQSSVVAVLQNGVDHLSSVPTTIAVDEIVPVVVSCPATRTAPGVIRLNGAARLTIPATTGGSRIAALFNSTFVTTSLTDDWLTEAWRKLIFNAAAGAVTTLTRNANSVLRDPGARNLTLALMHEAAEVARAEGARIDANEVPALLDLYIERAGDHIASITADRIAGVPTEWQSRNQSVVDRARLHSIAAPLNTAFTELLRLSEPTSETLPPT